jgi:hypothetical protein
MGGESFDRPSRRKRELFRECSILFKQCFETSIVWSVIVIQETFGATEQPTRGDRHILLRGCCGDGLSWCSVWWFPILFPNKGNALDERAEGSGDEIEEWESQEA